jgi:hypothetical protein
MLLRHCLALLTVLAFASVVVAAEPDLSSPKTAAKSLFNAVNGGDAAMIRQTLDAETEPQQDLAAAFADLLVAGKRIGDAASAKFGVEGKQIGGGMLDPGDVSKIDAGTVEEAGDSARLTVAGQQRPMSFRRRDGKWRLVITDFGGAAPENIAKQVRLVRMMTDAIKAGASDLEAGKYKTAAAARDGIQQRLHGVMLQFYHPATTRSTTHPAAAAAAGAAAAPTTTAPSAVP